MNLEIVFGILALVISIISLWVSFYYNKKSLEQSEKNTLAQITYEDKKKSLYKLMQIMEKYPKYYELEKKMNDFLKSSEGIMLPDAIKKEIYIQTARVDEFDKENSPYPDQPEPSDEEIEQHDKEVYEYEQSLPREEKFERELGNEIAMAKARIVNSIGKELNFPISKPKEIIYTKKRHLFRKRKQK